MLHAVDPKAAKADARFAPCGERPDLAPVEATQRPHGALAAHVFQIEVVQVQLVARLGGHAQGFKPVSRGRVGADRRCVDGQAFCGGAGRRGQHRQNLRQGRFGMLAQRRVQPRLGDAHGGDQGLRFGVAEHQRRQVETGPHSVAHTGFAFNRNPLRHQVGHVAVDTALRHLQPRGQKRSRAQTPATNQLDQLKQPLSPAHAGPPSVARPASPARSAPCRRRRP